jgi:hypothetical protein
VSGEELRQLAEAGVPAVRILANSMGKSVPEMTKMIEQGLVPASKALPMLVEGLEKGTNGTQAFGGMMKAQSKTLAGIMSTLHDEVNRGLVQGITPAIPQITAAVTGLTPAISKLAASFGSSLGPAISSAVDAFTNVAPVLVDLLPTVFDLMSTAASLVGTMSAFAPVLGVVTGAVSGVLNVFNALPGPLQTAIVMFGALRLVARKIPMDFAFASTGISTAMLRARASIAGFKVAVFEAMIAARTQMGAMVAAARVTAVGIGAAFRSIGVAAKGLMAGIGPVGWALLAVSVAMEVFINATSEGDSAVQEFTKSLQYENGVLDENSRKMLVNQLQTEGILDAVTKAGIGTGEYVDAVIKGGPALAEMTKRLDAAAVAGRTVAMTGRSGVVHLTEQGYAAQKAGEAAKSYAASLDQQRAASQQVSDTLTEMDAVTTQAAGSARQYTRAQADAADMTNVQAQAVRRLTAAGNQYLTAWNRINAVLNVDAAKSSLAAGWGTLAKAIKKSKGSLDAHTASGAAARSEWRSQAQNIISVAEHMTKPGKRAEYLTKKFGDLRAALAKAGVSPAVIDKMMGPLDKQAAKLKAAVKKGADAAGEAKASGAKVGGGLTDSILERIKAGQPALDAAAKSSGQATVNAWAAGAKAAVAGLGLPALAGMDAAAAAGAGVTAGYPTAATAPSRPVQAPHGAVPAGAGGSGQTHNYNFYGDIVAPTPGEAAREAQDMARLTQLGRGRSSGANAGGGYRR